MLFSLKCLVVMFVSVGAYKLTSDVSSDENYSLLTTNQSNYVPSKDYIPSKEFTTDDDEYNRKSSTDVTDIRSEALIKKIHPFVYPKQFNTLEGVPPRGFNVTKDNYMEIRNMEQQNSERFDDSYSQHDQKLPSIDLLPLGSNFFDSSKHGQYNYGYYDKPQRYPYLPSQANNCLLGLLRLQDPLELLGILGFVAYIINSVLNLVDRLNLPLLASSSAAVGMPTAAVFSATAATKTLLQNADEKQNESNQKLLKDFERILQMAQQKMNTL